MFLAMSQQDVAYTSTLVVCLTLHAQITLGQKQANFYFYTGSPKEKLEGTEIYSQRRPCVSSLL